MGCRGLAQDQVGKLTGLAWVQVLPGRQVGWPKPLDIHIGWYALDESRPLAFFAGIWTNWKSVRRVKEGETTNDLFGFLTTVPNKEVGAIHPKAMPVILRTADEIDTWLTATKKISVKWSGSILSSTAGSALAVITATRLNLLSRGPG